MDDGVPEERHELLERLGATFTSQGVPRMPGRVLAALMVSDSGELGAAELASALRTSPSAVSGAVRYLEQMSLIRRHRRPGTRRDVYVFDNNLWHDMYAQQEVGLRLWIDTLHDAADELGADSPAGRRLLESSEFFHFLRDEFAEVMRRWDERRAARDG